MTSKPSLFGINHSNRDFTTEEGWSKNNFNSAFPASLACYMYAKGISPVYLKLDTTGRIVHSPIDLSEVLGANPLDDDLYFAFESDFAPYQQLVVGNMPRIDLVIIFVWSNFAFTKLFFYVAEERLTRISRQARSILWLMKMLLDYVQNGKINHKKIIDQLSHETKNDKAFSAPGRITRPFMASSELHSPRVAREEIRHIILGGGQNLLSPERRLDAVLLGMPYLFE